MVKVVALAALLVLSACQTSPKGSFCALEEPDRFSEETIATMTDTQVRKSLAKNELGQRLCGWKP